MKIQLTVTAIAYLCLLSNSYSQEDVIKKAFDELVEERHKDQKIDAHEDKEIKKPTKEDFEKLSKLQQKLVGYWKGAFKSDDGTTHHIYYCLGIDGTWQDGEWNKYTSVVERGEYIEIKYRHSSGMSIPMRFKVLSDKSIKEIKSGDDRMFERITFAEWAKGTGGTEWISETELEEISSRMPKLE